MKYLLLSILAATFLTIPIYAQEPDIGGQRFQMRAVDRRIAVVEDAIGKLTDLRIGNETRLTRLETEHETMKLLFGAVIVAIIGQIVTSLWHTRAVRRIAPKEEQ